RHTWTRRGSCNSRFGSAVGGKSLMITRSTSIRKRRPRELEQPSSRRDGYDLCHRQGEPPVIAQSRRPLGRVSPEGSPHSSALTGFLRAGYAAVDSPEESVRSPRCLAHRWLPAYETARPRPDPRLPSAGTRCARAPVSCRLEAHDTAAWVSLASRAP